MATVSISDTDKALRVLLIDDSDSDLEIIGRLLSRIPGREHKLTKVNGYQSGLAALAEGQYDVCLLDYQLGAYDGLEFMQEPEAQEFKGAIIMLSGQGDTAVDNAAMNAGAADYIAKEELSASLLERVIRHAVNSNNAQQTLHYMALHDAVTGLINREVFLRHMEAMQKRHRERSQAGKQTAGATMLYIDMDGFKAVNDSMGHAAGDAALSASAQRLVEALGTDTPLARIGGDEFAALIEEADEWELNATIEKVLSAFRTPIMVFGKEIHLSTSVGAALYPNDSQDVPELIRFACNAMYQAKRMGRNKGQRYEPEGDQRSTDRLSLENQLRKALDNHELRLVYQPQFDMRSGALSGFEALSRWDLDDHGPVSPEEFIPLAEARGLIRPLTEWVVNEACAQMALWQSLKLVDDHVTMGVNISPQHAQEEGFVSLIAAALARSRLPAVNLELELTESVMMEGIDKRLELINSLDQLGARIAIDDFGKGYSSLSRLAKLPVDTIKIDRDFLRGVPYSLRDCAVARSIIALGDGLNMQVLAEGVETTAQKVFLKEAGCQLVQGYLYSEPLTAAECVEFLKSRLNDANGSAQSNHAASE